jgi:hypothetical protein
MRRRNKLPLDGFRNICAYRCPIKPAGVQSFAGALEDRTMLSVRSHIVAMAVIDRRFTRSNDCWCMRVTKLGPNYRPGRELGKPARA